MTLIASISVSLINSSQIITYSYILFFFIANCTKKENINKIKIIQNKCIRNLFFNQYKVGNISTQDLFKVHNILEFEKVIELELTINFYKIINKKLKCDINFELKNNIHNHATRQSNKLYKVKSRNKYGISCFTNRGISAFNVVPSPIKKAKNVILFKKKIKSLLIEKQIIELVKKPKKKKKYI